MTVNGQNFDIYQGDDKQITITVTDENNAILNLTGYSIVWVAYNLTSEAIVVQKSTTGGGITVPTPANGEIKIIIDGDDTENLPPKNYGHQCEIKDSSGNHSTVTTGYMKVLKSISHPIL